MLVLRGYSLTERMLNDMAAGTPTQNS
jgi:hypothetical protein